MDEVSREIISVQLVRSSADNLSKGLMASAPGSTTCHDWCISERTTLYQEVNTPKEPVHESHTATPEEKCNSPEQPPSGDLSIFQTEYDEDHVQLISSDEDEQIEVDDPPTITIESFDEDELEISSKHQPGVRSKVNGQVSSVVRHVNIKRTIQIIEYNELDSSDEEDEVEVVSTTQPKIIDHVQIVSSDEEEEIEVVGLELQPNTTIESFDVDETSFMVNLTDNDSDITENVVTGNVVDYEDRNSPGSDISQFFSKYPAILEGDSNFHTPPKIIDHVQILSSDEEEEIEVVGLELQPNTTNESFDVDETSMVNLPDNGSDITENVVTWNVVEYEDRNIPGTDISQFISTKYPAILEGDLDFHHLKGTNNIRERRTFCRAAVRAEMEKFYNESWGGENFDHEQILKHMPRDKHLWVIDERDRLRDESTVVGDHCDLPGHRNDTCPTKTPVCYICGLTGHLEPRCPRKNCLIIVKNAPLERCDQSKGQDQNRSKYPPTTSTFNTNQEEQNENAPQEHSPAWTSHRNCPYKRQLSPSPNPETQVKKKKIMPPHEDTEMRPFYIYF